MGKMSVRWVTVKPDLHSLPCDRAIGPLRSIVGSIAGDGFASSYDEEDDLHMDSEDV
ncbi:hypothetical protein ACLOJK_023256, partial [Asimina triloba]